MSRRTRSPDRSCRAGSSPPTCSVPPRCSSGDASVATQQRRRRRPPTRAARRRRGSTDLRGPRIDLGDRTPVAVGDPDRPAPTETPAGPSPIGSVAVTIAGVGIDLRQGAVEAVRHPDAAGADRDADGPVADAEPGRRAAAGLDVREEPVVDRHDPGAARRPRRPPSDRPRRSPSRRVPTWPGSIRVTLSSPKLVTQTSVAVAATALGLLPTGMRTTIRPVDGSILATSASLLSTTHTLPSPNAMPVGSPPTSIVSTAACVSGSTFVTLPLWVSVTQMNPPPAVMPPGVPFTGSDPVTVRGDELSIWRPFPGSASTPGSDRNSGTATTTSAITTRDRDGGDQHRSAPARAVAVASCSSLVARTASGGLRGRPLPESP